MKDLLSEKALREAGCFDPQRVAALVKKARGGPGRLSERENMAVAGIVSTQLLDHLFVRNFPKQPLRMAGKLSVNVK